LTRIPEGTIVATPTIMIAGVIIALLVLPVVAAIIRTRRRSPAPQPRLASTSVVAAAQARVHNDPLPAGLDDYLMSALRATGTRLPSEPANRVARGTSPPPPEPQRVRFDTEPPQTDTDMPGLAVRFSPTPGLRAPTTLDTAPVALPPVDDTDPYADPFDDDPPTLVTLRRPD
jgi:hypothetical protein